MKETGTYRNFVLSDHKEAAENVETVCHFKKENETYFTQCGNILEFNVVSVVPSLREGSLLGLNLCSASENGL